MKSVFFCSILAISFNLSAQDSKQIGSGLFKYNGTAYVIPSGKFPLWDAMLRNTGRDGDIPSIICSTSLFAYCYADDLRALLKEIKSSPMLTQLERLNAFLNDIRYMEDNRVYGVDDYWADSYEFFDNAMGDCEDYSITKYFALKLLGIPINDMAIVVVKDVNINIYHAVLAVNYSGNKYILDNKLDNIVKENAILHYVPVYAINEHYWWYYAR